jgi:hypothetical protein
MLFKAVAIWLAIAAAETLHGIARVRFLNRRLGDRRARQVAVFTGSMIILGIGWFAVPWIAPTSRIDCLAIGALWLGLMLAFDIAIGRLAFRVPWSRIAADFNPAKGGLLGFGMLVLFATPWIVAWVRSPF